MVTIYIDDSGSSPEHKVVVASGIIIPAKKLIEFEKTWNEFLQKEEISDFHTSECLAHNPRSSFANWDEKRSHRAIRRARKITLKYSVKGFCIAIYKKDYEELMPKDLRDSVGSWYTWALSSVLGMAYDWATKRNAPIEYVFDTADKLVEREIKESLEVSKPRYLDHFTGHYSFRKRKETPALQAADLWAWTCFQAGSHARVGTPIHPIAEENWLTYRRNKGWSNVESLTRRGVQLMVMNLSGSPQALRIQKFKEEQKALRRPKRKVK